MVLAFCLRFETAIRLSGNPQSDQWDEQYSRKNNSIVVCKYSGFKCTLDLVYGMYHLNRRCHWCIPKVAIVFSWIIVPCFSKSWINIFDNNNNTIIIIMTRVFYGLWDASFESTLPLIFSKSWIYIFLYKAFWQIFQSNVQAHTAPLHNFLLVVPLFWSPISGQDFAMARSGINQPVTIQMLSWGCLVVWFWLQCGCACVNARGTVSTGLCQIYMIPLLHFKCSCFSFQLSLGSSSHVSAVIGVYLCHSLALCMHSLISIFRPIQSAILFKKKQLSAVLCFCFYSYIYLMPPPVNIVYLYYIDNYD